MLEFFISFILFVIIIAFLKPKIRRWYLHNHCPYCHSWFCLKEIRFNPDTVVTGHDQASFFGGAFKILKVLGLFGGSSFVKDNPFLREFGKFDYLCNKCGKTSIIDGHRDRR